MAEGHAPGRLLEKINIIGTLTQELRRDCILAFLEDADLDEERIKLAVRAVDEPEGISEADMDCVRQAGWSDREIFDAVAQAASNRSFNTILRTFKVEHQGAFA